MRNNAETNHTYPKITKIRKNLTNICQNQHQIPATQKTSPKSPQKSTQNFPKIQNKIKPRNPPRKFTKHH